LRGLVSGKTIFFSFKIRTSQGKLNPCPIKVNRMTAMEEDLVPFDAFDDMGKLKSNNDKN
jgi:hypothetical protein